jgi:hypothetical protein
MIRLQGEVRQAESEPLSSNMKGSGDRIPRILPAETRELVAKPNRQVERMVRAVPRSCDM